MTPFQIKSKMDATNKEKDGGVILLLPDTSENRLKSFVRQGVLEFINLAEENFSVAENKSNAKTSAGHDVVSSTGKYYE